MYLSFEHLQILCCNRFRLNYNINVVEAGAYTYLCPLQAWVQFYLK